MDKRTVVIVSGLAALAILAVIRESAVMLVSAAAILGAVFAFRRARARDRVIAIIAAAIGGSIGAEIVRTLYHHLWATESAAGVANGGSFVSAMLIGLINAAAVITIIIITEACLKFSAGKSD
jgi:hypothetical protein